VEKTADTLEAIETLKRIKHKSVVLLICQVQLFLECQYFFMSNAGSEICVASTKVFTSQVSFGYLLAKSLIINTRSKMELSSFSELGSFF
jgi:glucosamine 6-phosphate synthetase-like amidotransferase/phosphosugar isomerase protein